MARAPKELKATEVRVITTRGGNNQPAGGWVTFSDGKHLGWGLYGKDPEISFTIYGKNGRRSARLPKREAALLKALDSGEGVDSSPIKISLD